MFWTLLNLLLISAWIYVLFTSLRTVVLNRKSNREPTCAVCAYAVVGLTKPVCPECGNNLMETGIRPPGKFGLRIGNAIRWSLLLLLAVVCSAALLGSIHRYTVNDDFDLSIPEDSGSPSLILDVYSSSFLPRVTPDEINVYGFGRSPVPGAQTPFVISRGSSISTTFVPTGSRATISFILSNGQWKLADPLRTIQTKVLTDEDVNAWLVSIGARSDLDVAHELVQVLMSAAATPDITHLYITRFGKLVSSGYSSGSSNVPDFTFQMANVWLFLFLWAYTLRFTLPGRPKPLSSWQAEDLLEKNKIETPSPVS